MVFKNLSSGFVVVAGVIGVIFLFRIIAWLAWVLIWPLLIVAALYMIGYHAPASVHDAFERKIIAMFDWLDFNAPSVLWPFISLMRGFFNWFGLQIKKS